MTQSTEDDLEELDDRALEAMVESSPADDGPYRILADRYFSRGEFHQALRVLDQLLASQPNTDVVAEILWHLAAIAYQGGDSDKARGYLERALPLISDVHVYFADIHLVLGHCCAERGEETRARKHYNTASFAPSATPEQIEMAQRCLRDIGEVGTA
jgi:tetratricopeptide (TPR) repeat protein